MSCACIGQTNHIETILVKGYLVFDDRHTYAMTFSAVQIGELSLAKLHYIIDKLTYQNNYKQTSYWGGGGGGGGAQPGGSQCAPLSVCDPVNDLWCTLSTAT